MGFTVPGHAFVGRSVELAQLEAAFEHARAGAARTIVVGGEAGVGKTRVVEELRRRVAARGATVLTGACLELAEAAPPYAPFVEALRGLVSGVEPARLPALLGPWRVELARVLPELELHAHAGAPVEVERSGQARLFEIILGVLERVAQRGPVVLFVEDIHWADRSTRDLLAFVVRNVRHVPVLVVITVRSDALDRHSPVLPFLAELQRDDRVDRVQLSTFDRVELGELVESMTGGIAPAGVVDEILERTDGNPFFAEQLVEASAGAVAMLPGIADLPPQLSDVLRARVATLSDSGREVLRAAAAAGRHTDDALLETVLDLGQREVADGLRDAIERGILERAGTGDSGYRFHHTLLREVVYDELLPGERRRLHAAFADAMASRGEVGGVPVSAADLAYHRDAAGDLERAVPAAVNAGRAAEAAYAFAEAARWYDRAIDLWSRLPAAPALAGIDRVRLLQRAAEAHVLMDDHDRAIALGREALRVATADGRDALLLGHLHDRLRWFQWDAGDHEAAAASLQEALAVIPVEPPTTIRARALAQLAGVHMDAGHFPEAAEAAQGAIEVARASGGRGDEALALAILGWVTALRGEAEAGIALFRDGLRIAEDLGGVEGIALGYAELARMLDAIGRPGASLDAAREGFAVTSRLGVERTYGGILLGHAINALLELGRWDDARAALDTALHTGYTGRPALWIRINEARLETGRGNLEVADAALQAAIALHAGRSGPEFRPRLLAAAAELAVARGSVTDARRAWDEAWAAAPPESLPDPAVGWLGALALRAEADELELATVRRDAGAHAVVLARFEAIAARLMAADEALSHLAGGAPREPRLVAIEALCRAEASRIHGEEPIERWTQAVTAWDAAGRPYPAAYCRLRLAESTIATREHRAIAEAALRDAHATTVRLGAAPLRRQIEDLARRGRVELAVSGGPAVPRGAVEPATEGDDGRELGLTPREAEILRLVAGGWSNQQIADRLFISRKTASVHVSNILGKLGVERREEAAAVAHRVGLGRDTPPPPGSEPVA